MFRKVHIRLTMLFTGVCTLVVAVMSLLYLYLSWNNIQKNSFISFKTDIANFSSTLSKDHVISQSWLMNINMNYSYQLYIYDNGKAMLSTSKGMSEENSALLEDIKSELSTDIQRLRYTGSVAHDEFSCSA